MLSASHATRWASAAGIVAVLALAVTGCTSPTTPSNGGKAASGGSIVVGITADAANLDPWKATAFQDDNDILPQIYGTLTEFDSKLNVVPGLAKSWTTSSDGLTLTFHLRSGVKFQNGAAFSSADVVSSLKKIQDPTTAAVARSSLANVSAISASDANTVVLTLSSPDASLVAALASINTAMLSTSDTEAGIAGKPDGTGPYKFQARTPNQSLTLVANPGYWRGKPTLSKVTFRVIPTEQSIVSAMQAGNVQLASISDPVVAKTAQSSGVTVAKTPQLSYHALQLNARRPVLANTDVRLAIQCAVDRKQVLDTAALGAGVVTGPITSPAYASDPKDQPCPTANVKKAKQYLTQSGQSNVTLDTIVSQQLYATATDEAQSLKSQLAKVGITLNLEVLDSNAYIARWVAGDFDAAVALNGGSPDPNTMYGRYFTSTGNLNKVAGYSSPTLDKLFTEGRTTADTTKRKAIYKLVSEQLTDNAAWVWLFSSYTFTATTKTVHGFVPTATGSMQSLRSTTVSK